MTEMFGFEQDFSGALRCIPIAVRFKLDACGIKLSLRQWSRFTVEDRTGLLHRPCQTAAEIGHYRSVLKALITERAGEDAKDLALEGATEWSNPREVPTQVNEFAHAQGVMPPSLAQWAGLSVLQRYALTKLSRDGHDNLNFVPALREFGLGA